MQSMLDLNASSSAAAKTSAHSRAVSGPQGAASLLPVCMPVPVCLCLSPALCSRLCSPPPLSYPHPPAAAPPFRYSPLTSPAVSKILSVGEDQDVAVVGTLFKDMRLKPSILDEYAKDPGACTTWGGGRAGSNCLDCFQYPCTPGGKGFYQLPTDFLFSHSCLLLWMLLSYYA